MNICHTIKDLKNALNPLRHQKIALVPTMGNLHDGHLSLVALAKQHADIVVVSIFVNPTQFGAGEDFASYPRTLDDDCQKLAKAGVALVFAPSVDEMYPIYPPNVQILSGSISKILCGQTRPTHFDGVGLVVSKLFNIVRPDVAVFGKKDYQQLAIIYQLVQELNFEIDIIGGEIVRADDGLALSSRNQYLTEQERAIAPRLAQALQQLAGELQSASVADFDTMIQKTKDKLTCDGFTVDYLQVLNQQLQPASRHDKHLVILTACYLGKARLLDNLEITLNPC
ncbi:pantoate--beta-alanine ligase [Moraxella catarrhalis]|uniref:pantoate--beta-alanine ligase n=1 Tax=Moraxella catarrhalis TaxID=480 RepID=UPI000E5584BC|nr:pantoate--beta-alanine ligase [Moraxella catarrhalis]AXT95881.1 pantoate--beta-alanine ligase [Moraxella catarrhalis]MCG6833847.1 pantoate--beta-alanine ligase [Moraxella catarrhalis]MCG6835325.1 pantoate--beta-alanine ligase [Moraxella catarrhalis]MPW82928.1 pantoate--beta-alanine ligase [Moraxella catarrhalis]RKL69881.1 pantoate--beta-alanine ligase [Moraxella catarrhalis]